jgi:hypothetical protein
MVNFRLALMSASADAGRCAKQPRLAAPALGAIALRAVASMSLLLCALAGGAGAADETARSPRIDIQVTYDPAADLISIRAQGVRLREVLGQVADTAAITVVGAEGGALSARASIDIERAPLERALRQLLGDISFTLLYSSEPAGGSGTRGRPIELIVGKMRAGPDPAREVAPATPSDPMSTSSESLVRQLMERRFAASEIVGTLTDTGNPTLRAETEEALLQLLGEPDFRRYGAAADVLKHLAPAQAAAALTPWLGDGDAQRRVVAVVALGDLQNDASVEPLTAALTGGDPVARQAAASSLARIGSPAATAALLGTYVSGDEGVRTPIAVAIASHGGQATQWALALLSPTRGSAPSRPTASVDWPRSNRTSTE